MNIGRVLARALEIVWRHKVLWVFGFVMALTGGGMSTSGSYSPNSRSTYDYGTPFGSTPRIEPAIIVTVLCVLACLFLIYLALVFYARFVARGALVSSVRVIENGETLKLGQAWRAGQSYYGRLLGLGFVVNLPVAIFTVFAVLVAVLPFIGTIALLVGRSGYHGAPSGREIAPMLAGMAGFIALLCCTVLCIVIVRLIIHPIYEFAARAIVLENLRTLEGLSRGYHRLRENLGTAGILYLALIGCRIGWGIVVGIVALPVLLVLALAIGGLATQSIAVAIAVALLIGIPFVLILIFFEGLFQVFESNAWTEGYLALLNPPALAPVPNESAPAAVVTGALPGSNAPTPDELSAPTTFDGSGI